MPEHRDTDKTGIGATRRTCTRCGRLGHLARTCQGNPRSVDKIGIEIEGWWRDLRAAQAVAREHDASGTSDGSLAYIDELSAWEFRTRPGSLGEAVNQLVALYPDVTHPSAGMHVHVSFRDVQDLAVLASRRFLEYHAARWESWGNRMGVHRDSNFWTRLRGDNEDYCALNDPERLESTPFSGTRYVQLNFTSFTRHRTLENRMLPLFRDLRVAVSAVEELVAIYEDFLRDADALSLSTLARSTDLVVQESSGRREIGVDVDMAAGVAAVSRTLEPDAPIAEVRPIAPNHVRLFGRRAVTEYVRSMLNQGGH